jgi:hypothetical protein
MEGQTTRDATAAQIFDLALKLLPSDRGVTGLLGSYKIEMLFKRHLPWRLHRIGIGGCNGSESTFGGRIQDTAT